MSRPIIFVSLGAASFGALLGCWIALSQSSVVTAVLPLLFALVGGAGGAVLWQLDLTAPANERKLEVFGAGATAFSVFCLGSMLLTIYNRTTIASWQITKPDLVSVTGHSDPLGALIYRGKLMVIGASNDEIKLLLNKPFPEGWKTNAELLDKFIVANQNDPQVKQPLVTGDLKEFLKNFGISEIKSKIDK